MTELLPRAFAALGQGPTARELELVADTLVAAGETAALEAAAADHEAFVVLAELASSAGSSGFVALDLTTRVTTGSSGVR